MAERNAWHNLQLARVCHGPNPGVNQGNLDLPQRLEPAGSGPFITFLLYTDIFAHKCIKLDTRRR